MQSAARGRSPASPMAASWSRHSARLQAAAFQFAHRSVRIVPPGQPCERAPQCRRRAVQPLLDPPPENPPEQPARLPLVQLHEIRIDARLHRTLPQQVRAERVDRPDERAVQMLQRLCRRRSAQVLQLLPYPQLHLARRLMRERHRRDALHPHALRDRCRDRIHQCGRLSGSGRGLHEAAAHASLRISISSRSSGWLFSADPQLFVRTAHRQILAPIAPAPFRRRRQESLVDPLVDHRQYAPHPLPRIVADRNRRRLVPAAQSRIRKDGHAPARALPIASAASAYSTGCSTSPFPMHCGGWSGNLPVL